MRRQTTLMLAAAATLAAACAVGQDPRADRVSEPTAVVLTRLSDTQVTSLVANPGQVRAFVEGQERGAGMRALRVTREEEGVRLDFRFPLSATTSYAVHHPALEAPLEVAARPREISAPQVIGVLPSAEELPSNVLRLYVEFDEPMSSKFLMSDVVEVVDVSDGRVVEAALLDVEQPLFDRENKRLTVVFNPGRTKRGVGSNEQGGPPLEPHRRYALRIKAGALDAQGDRLEADFEHVFRTGPAERESINVASWSVRAPAAGTRDALEIDFGRWVDPFQAEARIALVDDFGRRLPLRATSSGLGVKLVP